MTYTPNPDHDHDWIADPLPRPYDKACLHCGLEMRAYVATLEAENARLREALCELTDGDGIYYITQERAMAPGIAHGWPDMIPAPHTKNGRLVKRTIRSAFADMEATS